MDDIREVFATDRSTAERSRKNVQPLADADDVASPDHPDNRIPGFAEVRKALVEVLVVKDVSLDAFTKPQGIRHRLFHFP
jgi:hypothetical protein